MIKVVDAIMGSGKSSAAIQYMKEHPNKKYIVVTPYVDETVRFQTSLPQLDIKTPDRLKRFNGNKSMHLDDLVENGNNIAMTHRLFSLMTESTCHKVVLKKYTIFIDEAVDVFGEFSITDSDYHLITQSKFVIDTTTKYERENDIESFAENSEDKYTNGRFKDIFLQLRAHRFIGFSEPTKDGMRTACYWMMSRRMFEMADEVYILTYMFDGSILKHYLDVLGIEYENIGVMKIEDKNGQFKYCFSSSEFVPEYVRRIKSLVTVIDNDRMNKIGGGNTALSKNWYIKHHSMKDEKEIKQLQRNLINFFRYYGGNSNEKRMWAGFKNYQRCLYGRGYSSRAVELNARATNEYADVTSMAYCVNVFLSPQVKQYFIRNGCQMDEDAYALSILVQWIWRSAIRNGKEITVYIPSKRMRKLFTDWLDRLQDGEQR